jgi:membrane-associated phospholipid phosphatase
MKYLSFLLLFFISFFSNAQKVYEYPWEKEAVVLSSSALMFGGSYYLDSRRVMLSSTEINSAIPTLGAFDGIALNYNSNQAKDASDVLFYASSALPFAIITSIHLKGERLKYLLMFGETVALNGGVTFLVKSLTDRKRPYFYDQDVSLQAKQSIDARKSFFSGHTSHSAAMSFFTASVFSDLYPNSKWKPLVWAGAASIPAATAYLRVRAGLHFPTDVIVGYGVGAGIGLLVPFLHRKRSSKKQLFTMAFSGNGFSLSYKL